MKLAIINGSPRGKNSNSNIISSWITQNISDKCEIKKVYVTDKKNSESNITSIGDCDYILVIFPLYTDTMPGITKLFFENMEKQKTLFVNKPVLFVIHSGFPEMIHSRSLERYCKNFASLMQMNYVQCIILGGSEIISYVPANFNAKKAKAFSKIGDSIIAGKKITTEATIIPGNKEHLGKLSMLISRLFPAMTDAFWNSQLKKKDAYKNRFDQPYL